MLYTLQATTQICILKNLSYLVKYTNYILGNQIIFKKKNKYFSSLYNLYLDISEVTTGFEPAGLFFFFAEGMGFEPIRQFIKPTLGFQDRCRYPDSFGLTLYYVNELSYLAKYTNYIYGNQIIFDLSFGLEPKILLYHSNDLPINLREHFIFLYV